MKRALIVKVDKKPYTGRHMLKALARLLKALIQQKVQWSELPKYYAAMLHFERYLDRLNDRKNQSAAAS